MKSGNKMDTTSDLCPFRMKNMNTKNINKKNNRHHTPMPDNDVRLEEVAEMHRINCKRVSSSSLDSELVPSGESSLSLEESASNSAFLFRSRNLSQKM